MISTLTIGTIELAIDGDPYVLGEVGGLGSASIETTAFARPSVRGLSHIRSTYRERRVSLRGHITGSSASNYLANRRTFFEAFDISAGLFPVKMTLIDGTALQFEAVVENPIEAPFRSGESTYGEFLVELRALDPAFYSQTEHELTVGLTSGEVATNAGNIEAYPTLRINGPGTNFIVQSYSTKTGVGKTMLINGTLEAGEHYAINVVEKTVYRNGSINAYETFDGEWLSIEAGANNVTMAVASGEDVSTNLVVKWRDAYIGI